MVRHSFDDGVNPLDRLRPPKGVTFRQCTIRKWTPHNCRIASRRRCNRLLNQLPDSQWVHDFCLQVNLGIPHDIQDVEYELLKAIGVYELVKT